MYLPGVGPKRKEILVSQLNIKTWGDLIEYYPYKYVDRSRVYPIRELSGDMPLVQIKGAIQGFEEFGEGRKKRIVAHFSDGRDVVSIGNAYCFNLTITSPGRLCKDICANFQKLNRKAQKGPLHIPACSSPFII